MIKQGHKFHPHHPHVGDRDVVLADHYDVLVVQRDEGLTREAELRIEIYETAVIAQRITSALPIHRSPALRNNPRKYNLKDAQADARVVLDRLAVLADRLASPGCAVAGAELSGRERDEEAGGCSESCEAFGSTEEV